MDPDAEAPLFISLVATSKRAENGEVNGCVVATSSVADDCESELIWEESGEHDVVMAHANRTDATEMKIDEAARVANLLIPS